MIFNVYCVRCCKWMMEEENGWICLRCHSFLPWTHVGGHDRSLFHVSIERETPQPEPERRRQARF